MGSAKPTKYGGWMAAAAARSRERACEGEGVAAHSFPRRVDPLPLSLEELALLHQLAAASGEVGRRRLATQDTGAAAPTHGHERARAQGHRPGSDQNRR
jgi:hypothetical protein